MGRDLIIDTLPLTLQLEESDDGKIKFKGRFGLIGEATKNKRRYGESIMRREINRLQESIGRRRVLGELDHPRDGISSLTESSHVIEELGISGGEVIGRAEALDTPNGRILSALAKAGVEVGVSSRGFGSTVKAKNEDVYDVGEDFRLETYDFVYNPAAEGAYPQVVAEAFEAEAKLIEDGARGDDDGQGADELDEGHASHEELASILMSIGENGEASASDIARSLRIPESKAGRALGTLVKRGMVREKDYPDQDAEGYDLTKKGRAAFSGIKRAIGEGEESEAEQAASIREAVEQAVEQAREELEAESSAAKATLEQIGALAVPFVVSEDGAHIDITDDGAPPPLAAEDDPRVEFEGRVAELEADNEKLRVKIEEQKSLMITAGQTIIAERALRDVGPDVRDKILGAVRTDGALSNEDLQEKLAELVEAEGPPANYQAEAEELGRQVERIKGDAVKSYVEAVLEHHPDGQVLRPMLASVSSVRQAREVVEGWVRLQEQNEEPSRLRIIEDRVRARLTKGIERNINEDTDGGRRRCGAFPIPGMTEDEWDRRTK